MAWLFGTVLVVLGVLLLVGALPFVHYAARLWPGRHSRGSVDLMASSVFLNRFVGLVLLLAGVAVVVLKIIPD